MRWKLGGGSVQEVESWRGKAHPKGIVMEHLQKGLMLVSWSEQFLESNLL
jgi:hypothetical protein